MHTNRPATLNTAPPYFFTFQKLPHSEIFDILKIFNHTHTVFGPISFVQMLQTIARNIFASKTKLHLTIFENFTGSDLASNKRDWLLIIEIATTGAFILFPQISSANSAVHSARSNKLRCP
jgi:hypothetical protein